MYVIVKGILQVHPLDSELASGRSEESIFFIVLYPGVLALRSEQSLDI